MKTSSKLHLAISSLALFAFASCGSTKEKPSDGKFIQDGDNIVYEWWNNPGELSQFSVVGTANLMRNLASSRLAAENDARRSLSATLESTVQSISENWSQDVGDLENPDSFQSLVNNENFTRAITNATVNGTKPTKFYTDEENNLIYCLMILEDPADFMDNLSNEIDKQVIQDETYWKTEAMKTMARDRLDALINEQKEKAAAAVAGDSARTGG